MSDVASPPMPGAIPLPGPRSRNAGGRLRYFTERRLPGIILGLLLASLIAAILYPAIVVDVPSGHVGVMWRRFAQQCSNDFPRCQAGTVLDPKELLGEGIHFIPPWDEVFLYDRRLQVVTQTFDAISKDGVAIHATVAIRLRLNWSTAGVLHQFVGPDYLHAMVLPEIGNQVRSVISFYEAEDVYSDSRQEIQQLIFQNSRKNFTTDPDLRTTLVSDGQTWDENFIRIFDLLLLSIELPKPIVDAIDRKAEQFYFLEEYDFRLLTEEKEARRKETEARGIKMFQDIIASGITESYLRWRGIDATLQLSKSPNSKIIIVGGGKDGLPIILGNVDQPGAVVPPAAPERPLAIPDGTTGLEGPLTPPGAVSTPPPATTPTPPPATTPTPPPAATPPPSGRPSGPAGSPSR